MIKAFLRFFLPMLLLLGILAYGLSRSYYSSEREQTILRGQNDLELRKNNILNLIAPQVANTAYLSQSNLLLENFSIERKVDQVKDDLMHFARTHAYFEQIRILDSTGQEVLRLNNYYGKLRVVRPSELQSKSHRDYFRNAQALGPDEIYITPVEINIERRKVEVPYHAVLRIISPIAEGMGKGDHGLFVTNVSVENILESWKSLPNGNVNGLMLLNYRSGGIFIGDSTYDYRFKPISGVKLLRDSLPELWQEISSKKQGILPTGDGVYIYTCLNLASELRTNPSLPDINFYQPEDSDVILVKFVQVQPWVWYESLSPQSWWIVSMLFLIFVVLSVILTRRAINEQEMYHQISVLNDELIKSQYDLKVDRQNLRHTVEQLTRRNMQLKEFSQIISHNIRSPIAGLSLLVDFIQKEGKGFNEKEHQEMSQKLAHSVHSLNALAEDLLDTVQVLDKTEVEKEVVDLYRCVDKAKDVLMEQIIASGADIQLNLDEWHEIAYNRYFMESIVLNLMSNAIKYRDPNRSLEIVITTEFRNNKKILKISDTGLGINLEWHGENIFGLHKTFHRGSSGRGMGLFMTKTQLTSQGGNIEVESEEGKGTTFIVTF